MPPMRHPCVIVGGGPAAASAVEGIRAHDREGWILVLSRVGPRSGMIDCAAADAAVPALAGEMPTHAAEDEMSGQIRELLTRLRTGLEAVYGPRLRGLYLYGSFARGDADGESDVDVIIILDRLDAYGAEVARTSELISRLSLDAGMSISRVFVPQDDWEDRDSPFLANVRQEAIAA